MASLGIGKLDRVCALQARTLLTPNLYGEQIATFTTFATVWVAKVELSGQEQILAQQVTAVKTTRFRMYYRSDVDETCRIVVEGVTYQVTYVSEVGRRDWLEVTCTAIAKSLVTAAAPLPPFVTPDLLYDETGQTLVDELVGALLYPEDPLTSDLLFDEIGLGLLDEIGVNFYPET